LHIPEANADITDQSPTEDELSRSKEQLRALPRWLHEVREEESIRIARELHDQLGRCLTTMKMDLSWIAREFSMGQVTPQITRVLLERARGIGQAVDETVHIVRRISAELRPGPGCSYRMASAGFRETLGRGVCPESARG
jgi:signal transduction histidine kinase